MLKRIGFLSVLVLSVCFNLSFAGELVSREAVNYFLEGVKAQKVANFEQAEMNYQKTLLLDPYNPTWQKYITNNRGIMYADVGDLNNAEICFNEVLKMDPNYMPAKMNLGLINEKRRSRLESLEYWFKLFDMEKMIPRDFVLEE